MSDAEPEEKQNNKGNGHWDFEKAIAEKTVCNTCVAGFGPFLLQGQQSAAGIPVAPVIICRNTKSECHGSIRSVLASCRCWKEKQAAAQPKIVIAHKQVPPFKIGGPEGG